MADADAGDVGDRVEGSGLEVADHDSEISRTHGAMLRRFLDLLHEGRRHAADGRHGRGGRVVDPVVGRARRGRNGGDLGLDSVWIADHLLAQMPDGTVHGMHDAWTLLSAVAAVTSRVELGPLVLCSSFRDPGVVARWRPPSTRSRTAVWCWGSEPAGTIPSTRLSAFPELPREPLRRGTGDRRPSPARRARDVRRPLLPALGRGAQAPLQLVDPDSGRVPETPHVATDRYLGGCLEHRVVRGAGRQVPR